MQVKVGPEYQTEFRIQPGEEDIFGEFAYYLEDRHPDLYAVVSKTGMREQSNILGIYVEKEGDISFFSEEITKQLQYVLDAICDEHMPLKVFFNRNGQEHYFPAFPRVESCNACGWTAIYPAEKTCACTGARAVPPIHVLKNDELPTDKGPDITCTGCKTVYNRHTGTITAEGAVLKLSCPACGKFRQFVSKSSNSPSEYVFKGGIHEGLTMAKIWEKAPDYIQWQAENARNKQLRTLCQQFIDSRKPSRA